MNVLFTGGSGLLGSEVRKLRPGWQYPTHMRLDVADVYASWPECDVIVHAAAFTSPPRCDCDPVAAVDSNIIGTCKAVMIASGKGIPIVYVSTDYVFRGDRGNYAEEDDLHPVNKYAWSKLGGECAVRMYDKGLIVRGSFGPVPFPYQKAFADQWTSRIPVDKFARRLVSIVEHDPPLFGVVHIARYARTVIEYARTVSPQAEIEPIPRSEVPFAVPRDTSLISTRKDFP
jgi:dTDP-4-dehydrorhamnose reductase